jgi:hypothetical protein
VVTCNRSVSILIGIDTDTKMIFETHGIHIVPFGKNVTTHFGIQSMSFDRKVVIAESSSR